MKDRGASRTSNPLCINAPCVTLRSLKTAPCAACANAGPRWLAGKPAPVLPGVAAKRLWRLALVALVLAAISPIVYWLVDGGLS